MDCKNKTILFSIYVIIIFSFFGCAGIVKKSEIAVELVEDHNVYSREDKQQKGSYDGSLWRENSPLCELFVNPKARREGDIVTIKIIESSSASNKASTKTGRKSSFSGGIDNFFNFEKRYPSVHPFFNPFSKVKGSLESDFDGSGTTERSGALTAYITTRVVEVFPNGNLKISGSREVTVNNDRQIIKITGIIRPRDISPDNEILSTYVSDAKIEYTGKGIIDNRQRPGWLASIFNIIWPF